MSDLTPLEIVALSRLFDPRAKQAKTTRAEVEPGDYDIDVTVRVQGKLTVASDYESHIVAKADPWALLAVALDKLNGVSVDKLVSEAEQIAKARVIAVKKDTKTAMDRIKGKTITPCKGKVSAKLVATPLGDPTVSDNATGPKKPATVLVVKNTRKPRKKKGQPHPDQVSLPLA